jgi:hypothetical protein
MRYARRMMTADFPLAQMLVTAWTALLVILGGVSLMRSQTSHPETPASPGTDGPA